MAAWSWSTIEEGLGVALAALCPPGVALRWGEQDAPGGAGARPVVELSWMDAVPTSPFAEVRATAVDGVYIALEQETRICLVDCYTTATRGDAAATAVLDKIRKSLALEASRDVLAALGLRVIDRGPVRNVAALIDVRFEGRGQFELRLGYANGQTEDLSWTNTVEIVATLT